MAYSAGTYVKGDSVRVATTPADAVAAVWDGFKPAAEQVADDVDYRDLQAQAKALGIPANKGKADLQAAIAAAPTVEPTGDDGDSD